jgi:hypothetical protein
MVNYYAFKPKKSCRQEMNLGIELLHRAIPGSGENVNRLDLKNQRCLGSSRAMLRRISAVGDVLVTAASSTIKDMLVGKKSPGPSVVTWFYFFFSGGGPIP